MSKIHYSDSKNRVIYPSIEINQLPTEFEIRTTLRKKYYGKWYLLYVIRKWNFVKPTPIERENAIQEFHRDVYYSIICGQVTTLAIDQWGVPIYQRDMQQIDEKDRVKMLILNIRY